MKSDLKTVVIAAGVGAGITTIISGIYCKIWKEMFISKVQYLAAETVLKEKIKKEKLEEEEN